MWPVSDEMPASERFLSWPNHVFATIWNEISALERFFRVVSNTQSRPKPHFESLAINMMNVLCVTIWHQKPLVLLSTTI